MVFPFFRNLIILNAPPNPSTSTSTPANTTPCATPAQGTPPTTPATSQPESSPGLPQPTPTTPGEEDCWSMAGEGVLEGAEAPKELLAWRQAVAQAANVSQIACCLLKLHHCIAWEKSVMRVVSY